MRQSKLFTKTRKEAPADEVSKNAQLLIRAGFVHKEMAGVYSYLPLGLKVLKNIENIIREEMNKLGGLEMKTSALQSKEVWEKTNRWSDEVVDNWFKTTLKNGTEVGLSFTNEEAFSSLMKQYVNSYKDLPLYPYDFKEIFRNETRSKSGLMRGREFYWKAMYSFSRDEAEHKAFYDKATVVYQDIFKRVGLGDRTFVTFASGGTFSQFSHEFQTTTPAGEDIIYLDRDRQIAFNKEVYTDEVISMLGLDKSKLEEHKAVEVGNIFTLGTKFSVPFDLQFKNEKGESVPVFMGSYGIGLGRLMGTIVEVLSDEKGIVWPESVAPFKAHLVCLSEDHIPRAISEEIYSRADGNLLFDDRADIRAGEKFADADLLGMPYQIIVGKKSSKESVEVKNRKNGEVKEMSIDELISWLKNI